LAPTSSIWCSDVKRRREIRVGAPALFSRMKLLAYSPVWMSFNTWRMAFLVSSVTMRGPVTMAGALPGAEPMTVAAGKVVLDRTGRVLRAKGEVPATRGASHFESDEAELFLAEDGATPAMLILDGSLTGTYVASTAVTSSAGEESGVAESGVADRVDFRGAKLTVQFGAAGVSEPREMSLEGRGKILALLESVDGEVIHGLASRALWMQLEGGTPRTAQSTEPMMNSQMPK